MKIAIMGAGGVGGYFGGRLAASGADVAFVARGGHLEAIRAGGLRVKSANGDVTVDPANATDDPAAIGPVDIVLFATKLWAVEEAGAACKPLLKDGTGVVAFQNGVDATERLVPILGAQHVVGGVAAIGSVIERPGVIRHTGTMAGLQFGELGGGTSARLEALLKVCEAAGFDATIPGDIDKAIWGKFALLAPFSGLTAMTGRRIGPIREDAQLRAQLEAAVHEVVAVGAAKGVAINEAFVGRILGMIDGLPAEMTSSMAEDLERGNRLELPWLSGAVVRLGAALGVPTPVHAEIVAALAPRQDGAGG